MKKIICFSALACVLSVSSLSAFAGESTISGGYAQSDMSGVVNSAPGFNLKYRYDWDGSALGAIGSFTYTEDNSSPSNGVNNKGQYYSLTAGPALRLNDWSSIYGVVGMGHGRFTQNTPLMDSSHTDVGFTYGAGIQLNPFPSPNVVLDASYEQSRIRSVDIGTWVLGVGYRF